MDVNVSRGVSARAKDVRERSSSPTDAVPQDHVANHTHTKGPVGPEIAE
jgi:hypothetical protein